MAPTIYIFLQARSSEIMLPLFDIRMSLINSCDERFFDMIKASTFIAILDFHHLVVGFSSTSEQLLCLNCYHASDSCCVPAEVSIRNGKAKINCIKLNRKFHLTISDSNQISIISFQISLQKSYQNTTHKLPHGLPTLAILAHRGTPVSTGGGVCENVVPSTGSMPIRAEKDSVFDKARAKAALPPRLWPESASLVTIGQMFEGRKD
ncbi:hypothetical protein AKJ16_DCAP09438 [Drosera capensis]